MKLMAAVLRALPLDARGRRAVDEVVADWRHELEFATTPTARAAVTVRATGALVVAMTLITVRDVGHAAGDTLMKPVAVWLLLFTMASWMLLTLHPPPFVDQLPAGVWHEIKPGWVAVWAGWSVPFAFFAALMLARNRDRREARLIGLFICASAATGLVDGWLVPWFGAQVPMFHRSEFHGLVQMGHPTLSSAFLRPGWNVLQPLYQLNEALARAVAAGTLVLLAVQLWPARLWLRVGAGVVVLTAIYMTGFTVHDRYVAFLPSAFYERLLRAWLVPAVLIVAAACLALRGRRPAAPDQLAM